MKSDDLSRRIAELPLEKRRLLEILLQKPTADVPMENPSVSRRESYLPLSNAQQGVWLVHQLDPLTTAYNIPAAIRLTGAWNVEAFERALTELMRRQELLRARFLEAQGKPLMEILPAEKSELDSLDLRQLSPDQLQGELETLFEKESYHRFDLTKGRLLRTRLVRTGDQEHILFFTMHHIIADGWSLHIFLRELMALYDGFRRGEESPLPELTIQYADYAAWQREWLNTGVLEEQLKYWREQLSGELPSLALPVDGTRTASGSDRGGSESIELSVELTSKLKQQARREGVTLFMLLLGGFKVLLQRYSQQEDILVGTDVAGRNRLEVEGLIGFFVNQLVLRTKVKKTMTFRELLGQVRDVCLGAFAHQDVPFDRLVAALQPKRQVNQHPFFQVKFVYWQSPMPTFESGELRVSRMNFQTRTTKFDLTLFLEETPEQVQGNLEFHAELFERNTIKKFVKQYGSLLTLIANEPEPGSLTLQELLNRQQEQDVLEQRSRLQQNRVKFQTIKPKAVRIQKTEPVSFNSFATPLPLIIEPRVEDFDVLDWSLANRGLLEAKLLEHGAILFRGCKVDSAAKFEALARMITAELFNENGEHPRASVSGNVYTPVFYPPEQNLLWHNENSFNYRWPLKLFFGCLIPAQQGGETPIVDSRRVYQLLDPEIREAFERKQILYVRNYGEGLGLDWQTVFNTTDKLEVEARCRASLMEWEWKSAGRLRTRSLRPAIIRHPKTGEASWFNQAQHWHLSCLDSQTRQSIQSLFAEEDYPRHCYYGDGSPIADDIMEKILQVYGEQEVVIPWQTGDVMVLDNIATAHGRRAFSGQRRILVAMGEMTAFADCPSQALQIPATT